MEVEPGDEPYVGGRRKGQTGRPGPGSSLTTVFGMVERHGRAFTRVAPDVRARTLLPLIWKHAQAYQGHTVYTDELPSYTAWLHAHAREREPSCRGIRAREGPHEHD